MDVPLEYVVSQHGHYLATRSSGRDAREDLEEKIASSGRRCSTVIDFAGVAAMTISFADEFVGRFYASLAAGDVAVQGVLLRGLHDETEEAITVCLERRGLSAVAVIGGQATLIGAPEHLVETFRQALASGTFSAVDLSSKLGITPQNANNRLKQLVSAGAVVRRRIAADGGGREFVYTVPSQIPRIATFQHTR